MYNIKQKSKQVYQWLVNFFNDLFYDEVKKNQIVIEHTNDLENNTASAIATNDLNNINYSIVDDHKLNYDIPPSDEEYEELERLHPEVLQTKNEFNKLTDKQLWMLNYVLSFEDFVSPSKVGRNWGIALSKSKMCGSQHASKTLQSLVSKGLLIKNNKGHYKKP